jgi:sugar lactone lactonase YvrE
LGYAVLGVIFLLLALSMAPSQANRGRPEPYAQVIPQPNIGNPSFSYSFQFGSYGGPIMPNGVALDPSANVFIADAKNYGVIELTSTGVFLTSWGTYGTGPGQFRLPQGIALDRSGNVYVADSQNNNIQKFTKTGTFITSWNTWNGTNPLKNPLGLSVNSTGFVYVADQGDQRVQVYRSDGTYVSSFGGFGSNLVGKFHSPFGVVATSSSVFVSDISSGNLTQFTKTGHLVCAWSSTALEQPAMITADNASNLYVTDQLGSDVASFSPCNNKATWVSGSLGSAPGQFDTPVGVAVDSRMNVYVGNSNNLRVDKVSASSGSFIASLTYPRLGFFASPSDAALDGLGHIFVVDEANNRIQKFSVTGTFQIAWGTTGSGNSQFNGPTGIALDHAGNVYVADSQNNRVEKFYPNGTFISTWGKFGIGNGQFQNPFGVAVDNSNNIYVSDYSNDRVEKFDSSSNFLTKWGSNGTSSGQFIAPTGIVVDGSNNVYVADSGNNRIQKFTNSGVFVSTWGIPGSGNGQFNIPGHLALDSSGNIYVADTFNNRIQEFSSNGAFLTAFGTPGSGNGQLIDPEGLDVDSTGSAYVADTGNPQGTSNNRVEVFTPSSGSVGGATVPVDKLALLTILIAPIVVAFTIMISVIAFLKRKNSQACKAQR